MHRLHTDFVKAASAPYRASSVPGLLARARIALEKMIPTLDRPSSTFRTDAEEQAWRGLKTRLHTNVRLTNPAPGQVAEIEADVRFVESEYGFTLETEHDERAREYKDALDEVKKHHLWGHLRGQHHREVLEPLRSHFCDDFRLQDDRCVNCGSDLGAVQSDIADLDEHKAKALGLVDTLTTRTKRRPGTSL